jgi:hypothetical protein
MRRSASFRCSLASFWKACRRCRRGISVQNCRMPDKARTERATTVRAQRPTFTNWRRASRRVINVQSRVTPFWRFGPAEPHHLLQEGRSRGSESLARFPKHRHCSLQATPRIDWISLSLHVSQLAPCRPIFDPSSAPRAARLPQNQSRPRKRRKSPPRKSVGVSAILLDLQKSVRLITAF